MLTRFFAGPARRTMIVPGLVAMLGTSGFLGVDLLFAAEPGEVEMRKQSVSLIEDGNFKEAYDLCRQLVLDPATDSKDLADDFNRAVGCLQQLGRIAEFDRLAESAVDAHAKSWRLLAAVGRHYRSVDHYGEIIDNQFSRGQRRGGGEVVNTMDRDRVRALQLLIQATELVEGEPHEVAGLYFQLADLLRYGTQGGAAWRLQTLTDLETLPDNEEGWGQRVQTSGAPVDAEGNPVFHARPESFESAKSDGERWRWVLAEAGKVDAQRSREVRDHLANFAYEQFGVETIAQSGIPFGLSNLESDGDTDESDTDEGDAGDSADDDQTKPSGTFALHTLADDETIAQLASGVRRFKLPDDYNYIKIYKELAAEKDSFAEPRIERLAGIYENRRQYPAAAEWWQRLIERFGTGQEQYRTKRLEQITGNWGRFEPQMTKPAGEGAELEFRFRNGRQVNFDARRIDIEAVLADVKQYLSRKSRPQNLDWQRLGIGQLGYQLIVGNQTKYVNDRVADWQVELEPREDHFDRRITVTTPLIEAGAYLLTARMKGGNTSQLVVWLADTAIVQKPLEGKMLYYVADARSGRPVAKANVEFFGFRVNNDHSRANIDTKNFAELTNGDGQVVLDVNDERDRYQWLITARTDEGRLAYLGFNHVWHGRRGASEYSQTKVFAITDRPVYRPNQTVQFKAWARRARYDADDEAQFAGKKFTLVLNDPRGDEVLKQELTADAYGGVETSYEIPSDATLGAYQASIIGDHEPFGHVVGGINFRVEEYKKPEFEVTIEAPAEPVMLGEEITATIESRYYFGAAVTNATVKYKVLRSQHDAQWYPRDPWDWLYGQGYWWFGYDYDWYPGWRRWGCVRPTSWWWPRQQAPSELVADVEVPIGEDGKVEVKIDTALAKEIHGDTDHSYQITAEVVDESRRTIVGQGRVLVARKPFQVFAWVDRGHYRVGDTVTAQFNAHTLDHRPVEGEGKLKLFKISYNGNGDEPKETLAAEWDIATGADGQATQKLTASEAGQYRLSYTVTDSAGHEIEGGYVFNCVGPGFDGTAFRFNDLELIAEDREYAPGDTMRLMINTNRADSTVLLFLRPENGVYDAPKLLRLDGKGTIAEINVTRADMPNFFVEAVTIADGEVHNEVARIAVPPEKRVINVAVEPSAEEYLPGAAAEVKLTLTDQHGEPVVGQTVVSIYDKSVEYISGGSNVSDIKEFFWKWVRNHQPNTQHNLGRFEMQQLRRGQIGMSDIGIFGGTVVDEVDKSGMVDLNGRMSGRNRAQAGANYEGAMTQLGVAAPPMSASADEMFGAKVAVAERLALFDSVEGRADVGAGLQEPTVRKEFADTALWVGALETDGDGVATVKLDMPENLTAWKIAVWGMGQGTRVGSGDSEVVTSKNLIVRLQAPRFFVETDEVVLSANVHNYLEEAKQVQVELDVDTSILESLVDTTQTIEVPAGGEQRVDWRVRVVAEGEARVQMRALTDEESDAVEQRFPAYVHGMLKTAAHSGAIAVGEDKDSVDEATFTVTIPTERRKEQTRLEIRYSPTLAGAMVDALPYLAAYPYGCTEQTLNRFLPTVVTQKILLDLGLDLKAIRDKRTNLNAQQLGDPTERAAQWKQESWRDEERNPVFDVDEVNRMVKQGVERLTEMQVSDGGWGWFSGYGERSYPHTTAVVVHGLQIAQQNDVAIVPDVLAGGIAWLERYQAGEVKKLENAKTETKPYKRATDAVDVLVYMVLADADRANNDMLDFLRRDRPEMNAYSLSMFGTALAKQGHNDELASVMRNLDQYVVEDNENQTAYLRLPDSYWWSWYGNDIEAMAYYLKLLARTDPKGGRASRLVKYLLNNRQNATYWRSTRDTALCVEALADYLRASDEMSPDMHVEVWFDGEKRKDVHITGADLFTFDGTLSLAGEDLTSGPHTVKIVRRGTGPLYFNAYTTNFTLEEFITRAGLEVKVDRRFYRLTPLEAETDVPGSRGQAISQRIEKYEREPLENHAQLTSGDLVEVELVIESKNDYEYLLFEDMKAAGFEAVDVRSGYTGNSLGAYMELRDNRVVMFVRELPRGRHSITYRLRAEIPGSFSALPAQASGMYAPELAGNSDEMKLGVVD
jgi:hypothetical protein